MLNLSLIFTLDIPDHIIFHRLKNLLYDFFLNPKSSKIQETITPY